MNELTIGDRVQLVTQPPYFKTADSMPMLRPANLIAVGEEGIVCDRRPGGYWSVRFNRGLYLVEMQYLQKVSGGAADG
jgi:hypothetical protein